MATIMCLPDKVIEMILGYNDISIEDIINFRYVWKQFYSTAKYVEYWERIFFQRWPTAKKFHDKQYKENEKKDFEEDFEENEQKNERNLDFIETGINCATQLRDYVFQIIHKHYHIHYYEINNLIQLEDVFPLNQDLTNHFDEIFNEPEHYIKYYFFIDEIKNLLKQSPRRTGCDLTERYSYQKIFRYMRQRSLKKKWDIRVEKQPDQLLERIATNITQLIQPEKDIFYLFVKTSLDNIALEVLDYLRKKHPNHSIFSTSDETFTYWKNNNIDENYWNEAESTLIMDTLEEYIFDKLNFRPCRLEDKNLEYIHIDNVLKNKYGQEIIILIIYHSVARRLGLRCDVIKLHYYYIFWKPKHSTNGLENARCFYIISKKFPDCLVNKLYLVRTLDSEFRKSYKINATEFKLRFNKPKCTRLKDVKYAVGMIVKYKDELADNYTGVILAWHRYEDRHVHAYTKNMASSNVDIDVLLPFNCRNSFDTNGQISYIILTEDNKICYVQEDNITLTRPKWIDNSEIGRYFCKFEDTHYVPNQMLASLFPQDAAITAKTTISDNNNYQN